MISKKILSVICTLILGTMFYTNTASAWSLSNLIPKYSVSGKVTNYNKEPVAGAKIVIESKDGIHKTKAITDENGNYNVGISVNGNFWVTITKEGGYRSIRSQEYIGSNSNTTTWNFTLYPDKCSVSGKITDENRDPVQGATISFEPYGGRSGILSATTDEYGNYHVGIPIETDIGFNVWVTITKDGYKTYHDKDYMAQYNTTKNYHMKITQ